VFDAPDLCRLPLLFSTLVAAELVVLVIWLAPSAGRGWHWEPFFAASTLAIWLALCSAVMLCKLRPILMRMPVMAGALCAWLVPVATTWLGSLVIHYLDLTLQLQLGLPDTPAAEFAGGNATIAAVICAALLRYFHVQQQWLRNERAQARAAVEALQARIRPHFLFNSMNTIASLVRRDPATAERAVEDLADLFRAALGASEGLSSLKEELDLCRQYLNIEKLRLADRLQVAQQIEAGVDLATPVPRLSLQPLVENAIHHGIARLPAGGTVSLVVRSRPGAVEIEIGNPCPPASRPAVAGNRHALDNIAQRLDYHFAQRAGMTRHCQDGYYLCTVRLPAEERVPGDANPHR